MKHFVFRIATLTAILILVPCLTVWAAGAQTSVSSQTGKVDPARVRALTFSFPDEHSHGWGTSSVLQTGRVPLGTMTATAANTSPGQTIGWTYYEYQHNCSMGRMVETGPHSGVTGPTTVHFGWMHLPDSAQVARTYMYNAYKSSEGQFAGSVRLHHPDSAYSGYVNVDVTPDNRALVGGHCDEKGPVPYQTHIHFDLCSACEVFDAYVRVPDSISDYDQEIGNESEWPKFFFQFGSDTVLHIVAQCGTDNRTYHQTIMYFRKVGYEGAPGGWDFPPYLVDSVPTIAHDITGERLGDRVCMAWFGNLPYQEPECDTCSGTSPYEDLWEWGYPDNDMYLQISDNQGVDWNPRKNLTNAGVGQEAFKAHCDCSILFDQGGTCHILFHAIPWPADPCIVDNETCMADSFHQGQCRLMHWSEDIEVVRTVADHTYWPSDSCGPPGFGSTIAKMSLSECDGKLYALWTQFNDIPNGIDNDCAQWVYDDETAYWWGTNGELWISASSDGGVTWDAQRNLTNSYTPHCDPWGGEACQNDYWASMSRWGKQAQPGEDWSGAEIVDPTGGAATDYYLDIMYINDLDAGFALHGYGTWVNAPVKWFRIPCYEPDQNPIFAAEWHSHGYPAYVILGDTKDTSLWFENLGNATLNYTITVEEDNGPTGWLDYSEFDGTIYAGLDNRDTGIVHLNKDNVITEPGTYTGRLHVEGPGVINLPVDIEITLLVTTAPIDWPTFDIVSTSCLSLVVSDYGNAGKGGEGKDHMDYYPEDCDSTATVYLYESSPFLGRIIDSDTTFVSAIYGANHFDIFGFRGLGDCAPTTFCQALDAEVFESGTFFGLDSTVAFEKIWVAPAGDCEFIIEHMRVWSFDGAAHEGLMIGEIVDWDIPWDFLADDLELEVGAVNYGRADGPRALLYQQGYEAYGANVDTGYPYNCQYNDERFGGSAFVESYLNGEVHPDGLHGGGIGENDVLIYPANLIGEPFVEGAFYEQCMITGLRGSDSTEDLHAAMTFLADFTLAETDVYEVVTVLATVQQGVVADLQNAIDAGKAWYVAHGGMAIFDDDDSDGLIDICQSCCRLIGDFQHDNDLDPLDAVAFVNWMWRDGPPPDCLEENDWNCDCDVNPLDAIYCVNFFWRGGPSPVCPTCEELIETCQ